MCRDRSVLVEAKPGMKIYVIFKLSKNNRSHSISQIFHPIDFLLWKLPLTVRSLYDISATRSAVDCQAVSGAVRGKHRSDTLQIHA